MQPYELFKNHFHNYGEKLVAETEDGGKIKGLKNEILKSGIPLEASVIEKLAKFGLTDKGEIEYERDGKIFSTDIMAEKEFQIFENLYLSVNFAIECKYKTKNHRWFFMKFREDPYFRLLSRRHRDYNSVFDLFFEAALTKIGHKLAKERSGGGHIFGYSVSKDLLNIKKANKGVELCNKEFNPNVIREAVSQSIYGSIKTHVDSINHILAMLNFVKLSKKTSQHATIASITIPVVITTAKLFGARTDISIEDIEKSENVLNLFTEERGVLLIVPISKAEERFTIESFQELEKTTFHNKLIKSFKYSPESFFMFGHITCRPNCVYIINYDHVEELFGDLLDRIEKNCTDYAKENIE